MEVEFAIVESVHSCKAFASLCVFRTYTENILPYLKNHYQEGCSMFQFLKL